MGNTPITGKKGALTIDKTNIGYSKAGVDNLVNALTSNIQSAADKINPDKGSLYKDLIKILDDYWDGEDYDEFCKTLKAAASELSKSLANYKKAVSTKLSEYKTKFKNFQVANATQIQSTLNIK